MHLATATCSLVCVHKLDNRRGKFYPDVCIARARSSSVYVYCRFTFPVSELALTFSWYSCPAVTREYSSAEVFDCARKIAYIASSYVRSHLQIAHFDTTNEVSGLRCRMSVLQLVECVLISSERGEEGKEDFIFCPFRVAIKGPL